MKTNGIAWAGAILASALWLSCQNPEPESGLPQVPVHFPEPIYLLEEGPKTRALFLLGKSLFYDAELSSDKQVSCGSCHAQAHGFADHNIPLSAGVEGRLGMRNAPSIVNAAWNTHFMWDGGITHLDFVSVAPFTHPDEMNLSMDEVVARVGVSASYKKQFAEAFGSSTVTDARVLKALSAFMSRLISADSPYDRYLVTGQGLSAAALKGLGIFRQHCTGCHSEPLTSNGGFHSNAWPSNLDVGRYRITENSQDSGKFKVPSLRNVARTYPYMHDGTAKTLEQVVSHYNSLNASSGTEESNLPVQMNLSHEEQRNLISFLESLTDEHFLSNPLFAP